jgi:hypothetical protein
MREYVIEDAFRDEVARRGGLALKFTSQTMNGLPDRLVLTARRQGVRSSS